MIFVLKMYVITIHSYFISNQTKYLFKLHLFKLAVGDHARTIYRVMDSEKL